MTTTLTDQTTSATQTMTAAYLRVKSALVVNARTIRPIDARELKPTMEFAVIRFRCCYVKHAVAGNPSVTTIVRFRFIELLGQK